MMLELPTDMGKLTVEDHHAVLVLESSYQSKSGLYDDTTRHSLHYADVEKLYFALGLWLGRQRKSNQGDEK